MAPGRGRGRRKKEEVSAPVISKSKKESVSAQESIQENIPCIQLKDILRDRESELGQLKEELFNLKSEIQRKDVITNYMISEMTTLRLKWSKVEADVKQSFRGVNMMYNERNLTQAMRVNFPSPSDIVVRFPLLEKMKDSLYGGRDYFFIIFDYSTEKNGIIFFKKLTGSQIRELLERVNAVLNQLFDCYGQAYTMFTNMIYEDIDKFVNFYNYKFAAKKMSTYILKRRINVVENEMYRKIFEDMDNAVGILCALFGAKEHTLSVVFIDAQDQLDVVYSMETISMRNTIKEQTTRIFSINCCDHVDFLMTYTKHNCHTYQLSL